MTKYTITAPEGRFNGEFAGLVFRAGRAAAETPADRAAVTYCRRRGYTVTEASDVVTAASAAEPNEVDHEQGVAADSSGDTPRPADYASKAAWIAYAVHKGASEEDAQAATKNELIELYG